MIETITGLIRFAFSLFFGITISVLFVGLKQTRKNNITLAFVCTILLFAQYASLWLFGLELTSKLYPFIIHIPMILLFSLYFKRPWLISTVSVISAYLCCQAPRWIGFIAGDAFKSNIADHISYVISIILAYFLLKKYVANSVRQLMEKSNQSLLLFAAVPIFYYLFDYATIIYPDILYRDAKWVVQFIPTVVSVFYFIFITLYYTEILKQAASQRERDMLNIHLQHSKTELTTLRQLQECTAVYRHDMRHHITFLQGLASKGRIDEIKEYLKTAQSDIENITPVRFCENETVNLLLSAFSSEAKQKGIKFSIEANLLKLIPLTDTEICSLLSNSLENAINAASKCSDPYITAKLQIHKNNLLISISNPYTGEILLKDGHPQSHYEDHGFGTRSIVSIAEKYGGQAIFSVVESVFSLKIMIPLA